MTATAPGAVHDGDLDRMLGRLVGPPLTNLAAQLRSMGTLSGREQQTVTSGARAALREALWQRVDRVLVLELHAARRAGTLTAADSPGRWQEWVASLERQAGWEALAQTYPPLLPRLRQLISNRCAAALSLAGRFATDRAGVATLLGSGPGELTELRLGAGDSHRGGHTVSMLHCEAGRVVYKPRSLAVDAALARLLRRLLPDQPPTVRVRVPAVIERSDQHGDYGWAEHVAHRYCADEPELRQFYRGLGHWLAVIRLLGGSDLHSRNLIAAGPVPVIVDCETMFTPLHRAGPSGYGQAFDAANEQVRRSPLRTGLLPGRGATLGLRGADGSAAGALPGQQPSVEVQAVVDFGTDQARLATGYARPAPAANLPSPNPDLDQYWPLVVEAFRGLATELRERDRVGELAPLLDQFAGCQLRVVLRDTGAYAALERMLWHPKALHNPELATARAAELLTRQADKQPGAPADPAVIAAEIADLLVGDVPIFTTTAGSGVLEGPGGTRLGHAEDLVASALAAWRDTPPAVDQQVVQAALVGAYLDVAPASGRPGVRSAQVRHDDPAPRRRAQAAAIMRQLAATVIRGDDRTVTWVSPGLDATGWAIRPLGLDLYNGVCGMAILLAGYQHEVAAGRADPVGGLDELRDGALATLKMAEEQDARERIEAAEAGIRLRPAPAGGYLGLGSRIWGWLVLADLAVVANEEAHRRAVALAGLLPEAVEADQSRDLLSGAAGAIVPLLRLAERTGQPRWQELAHSIGNRLREQAIWSDGTAYWASRELPDGLGGLSHGTAGIGWALARLASRTGDPELAGLAEAAFAYDETYYDPRLGGWRHPRASGGTAVAWCHGSVGIGVAAADLLARQAHPPADRLRDRLRRAADATWPGGFGATHTLCHGDMSAWELLARASVAGVDPPVALAQAEAELLTSLEDRAPATALTRDPFTPSLLPGLGGAAYQLLRMHPDCQLPSLLLPDPGPGSGIHRPPTG
jgi:type 2 lantibiotic biosynthesis protein LanM